jgi:adenosylcobinamide-GDP ribazoletransferase
VTRPTASAAPPSPEISRGRGAVAELRAGVSFLTRISVDRSAADLNRTGAAAFGLVGAAIGAVGAVPLLLLGSRLPMPAAVLAILLVVLASGGLHLDGLADTADALAAPTPDSAERARTDPRVGAVGVAAIALDLLLGASFLGEIAAADPPLAAAALVVAAAGSRAAAPVAAWADRRRRAPRHGGLGGWFSTRVRPADLIAAVLTTFVVVTAAAVAAGAIVAIGTAAGLAVGTVGAAVIVGRRGQLDGDGYGAIVEIAFVSILAGVAISLRLP